MKREFLPKIDKAAFGEFVTEEREGDWYGGYVKDLFQTRGENTIYERFMAACADENIKIICSQEHKGGGMQYNVTVWLNGYEMYYMTYSNPDTDITETLARTLYRLLKKRFFNEAFFKEYLPERAGQIYPGK